MNDSSLRVERAPAPGAGTPSLLAKQLASVVATSAITRTLRARRRRHHRRRPRSGLHRSSSAPARPSTGSFATVTSDCSKRISTAGSTSMAVSHWPSAPRIDAGFDNDTNMLVSLRNRWHELRYSNRSIAQAKANARFHYGLGQRVLQAVARRAGDDVHVRVLERGDEDARGGAAQQDGSRLPQGAARPRRDVRRRRQRLGRAPLPRVGAIRRPRDRRQRDDRAGRRDACRNRAPQARRPDPGRRVRLP